MSRAGSQSSGRSQRLTLEEPTGYGDFTMDEDATASPTGEAIVSSHTILQLRVVPGSFF